MKTSTKTTTLSLNATQLLQTLRRRDLDYTTVDLAAFVELQRTGLAAVIFGSTGNHVFATSRGRAA